jgi:hypothetical protein
MPQHNVRYRQKAKEAMRERTASNKDRMVSTRKDNEFICNSRTTYH